MRFVMDHRAGLPVLLEDIGKGAMFDAQAMCEALGAGGAAVGARDEGGLSFAHRRAPDGRDRPPRHRQDHRPVLRRRDLRTSRGRLLSGPERSAGRALARSSSAAGAVRTWMPRPRRDDGGSASSIAGRGFPEHPCLSPRRAGRAATVMPRPAASERIISMLAQHGTLDGKRILSAEAVDAMTAEQYFATEIVGNRELHQALCLIRTSPPWYCWGPNRNRSERRASAARCRCAIPPPG